MFDSGPLITTWQSKGWENEKRDGGRIEGQNEFMSGVKSTDSAKWLGKVFWRRKNLWVSAPRLEEICRANI